MTLRDPESATAAEMLERERELATVDAYLERLGRGSGGVLLLGGPAGIGKTELVRSLRERAAGVPVELLGAVGGELESEFPFGIARQLLEPALAALSPRGRRALFSGAAALAEPVFSIGQQPPDDTIGAGAGADVALATQHGLYWLVSNFAEAAPLLIVVDDAQWADPASLSWLLYLARRLEGLPVGLVIAHRAGEPGEPGTLLTRIAALPITTALELSPLSESAVTELIEAGLGPSAPEFCAACHDASGGNPFMLRELLGALAADHVPVTAEGAQFVRGLGPETISRAMMLRLARLPPEAEALVFAVAVLGVDAELRHAAALAELDEDTAAAMADALSNAAILRTGRPLEFVHPIVRQAMYAQLPAGARALAHARAARMLAAEQQPPERVAVHLLVSEPTGGDAWVVDALASAARVARERGAPDMAIAYLERALLEPPRPELRTRMLADLGRAEAFAGRSAAVEHLEAAFAGTEDARQAAGIALDLAFVFFTTLDVVRGVDVLERALVRLGDADDELRLRLEAELTSLGLMRPDISPLTADDFRKRARTIDGATPGGRLVLAGAAYRLAHGGAPAAEAARVAEKALACGRLLEEEPPGSLNSISALYALGVADRLDPVDRYSQEALARASAAGSVPGYVRISSVRAWLALWRGDVPTGLAEARNAQAVAELNDGGGWMPHTLAYLIDGLVSVGEHDEANERLERLGLLGDLPVVWPCNWLLYSRGRLRLETGSTEEGLADLMELARRQEAWGNPTDVILPWRAMAAGAHMALGDRERALEIARSDVAAAANWGTDRARGVALRGLGLAEQGAGGIATLREAAALLESSPAVLEHAETLLALGAALRRSNQRAEARPLLSEAMDRAGRCGATFLVEHARVELLATGARPRRVELSGAEALTASQRRVAELAADGLSNRAIAQSLFVTINTVETHLRHAFQKLGIASRHELTVALAESHGRSVM